MAAKGASPSGSSSDSPPESDSDSGASSRRGAQRSAQDELREHYQRVEDSLRQVPGFGEHTTVAIGETTPHDESLSAAEVLASWASFGGPGVERWDVEGALRANSGGPARRTRQEWETLIRDFRSAPVN